MNTIYVRLLLEKATKGKEDKPSRNGYCKQPVIPLIISTATICDISWKNIWIIKSRRANVSFSIFNTFFWLTRYLSLITKSYFATYFSMKIQTSIEYNV